MVDLEKKKFLSIGEVSELLGVHIQTLRNWDKSGRLKPDTVTPGGTRRYNLETVLKLSGKEIFKDADRRLTIVYARVNSHEEKEVLDSQVKEMELYCTEHHFTFETISDIGSGLDYYKRGLSKMINLIMDNEVKRLVLPNNNTLLTFGSELIFSICEHKGVEVVILNKGAMQEENGDEYSKDIQEVIQKLTAKLATKTSEKAKEVRQDLDNVYNKLD